MAAKLIIGITCYLYGLVSMGVLLWLLNPGKEKKDGR